MEPGEHVVQSAVRNLLVAHVDDHRHPHDVLDPEPLRKGRTSKDLHGGFEMVIHGCDCSQTRFALSNAAWSDSAKPLLVYVAPETISMFGLNCA
jgi:hypothetical protein